MSRADVTAATVYLAMLAVPGRRIPRFRPVEEAVLNGEQKFVEFGCAGCHTPELPLDDWGWVYVEPNPFNPEGNARPGDIPEMKINLNREFQWPPAWLSDAPHGLIALHGPASAGPFGSPA